MKTTTEARNTKPAIQGAGPSEEVGLCVRHAFPGVIPLVPSSPFQEQPFLLSGWSKIQPNIIIWEYCKQLKKVTNFYVPSQQ